MEKRKKIENSKKIKTYYILYSLMVEDPRTKAKDMAIALGRSGRGQTVSSATRQLYNMYKKKVSFPPRMTLKNYDGYEFYSFFCRKRFSKGISGIFFKLYKMTLSNEINLAMCLAGVNDFFILSRNQDISFENLGLETIETSKVYNPFTTTPNGSTFTMKGCVHKMFKRNMAKGQLDRKSYGNLDWKKLQWDLYEIMHKNLRIRYKYAARKLSVFSDTVKYNFCRKVLPCCTILNYFFPRGYREYGKILLKFKSEYEKSLIGALDSFPCTSYVYPLEDETIVILFHEGFKQIFLFTKKLEEKGLIKDILLYVPLAASI